MLSPNAFLLDLCGKQVYPRSCNGQLWSTVFSIRIRILKYYIARKGKVRKFDRQLVDDYNLITHRRNPRVWACGLPL